MPSTPPWLPSLGPNLFLPGLRWEGKGQGRLWVAGHGPWLRAALLVVVESGATVSFVLRLRAGPGLEPRPPTV